MNRREAVRAMCGLGFASSGLGSLAGCSTRGSTKPIARIALLAPMTGAQASLGLSMDRAARLVGTDYLDFRVVDTNSTVAGAIAASSRVQRFQPDLVIGPASSDETMAVESSVPVVTLSNDDGIDGAFVLGVTATQLVGAVFTYARQRGVRTVSIIAAGSVWSAQCERAAAVAAVSGGVELIGTVSSAEPEMPESVVDRLRAAAGGATPNAVLLPEGGEAMRSIAGQLTAAGIQIISAGQWSANDFTSPETAGAWVPGPDPAASTRFFTAYRSQYGEAPGRIAGLTFDAMAMAVALARIGGLDRAGLLAPMGFPGVVGPFRFIYDGRAQRRLSILVATPGGPATAPGGAMPWA